MDQVLEEFCSSLTRNLLIYICGYSIYNSCNCNCNCRHRRSAPRPAPRYHPPKVPAHSTTLDRGKNAPPTTHTRLPLSQPSPHNAAVTQPPRDSAHSHSHPLDYPPKPGATAATLSPSRLSSCIPYLCDKPSCQEQQVYSHAAGMLVNALWVSVCAVQGTHLPAYLTACRPCSYAFGRLRYTCSCLKLTAGAFRTAGATR